MKNAGWEGEMVSDEFRFSLKCRTSEFCAEVRGCLNSSGSLSQLGATQKQNNKVTPTIPPLLKRSALLCTQSWRRHEASEEKGGWG